MEVSLDSPYNPILEAKTSQEKALFIKKGQDTCFPLPLADRLEQAENIPLQDRHATSPCLITSPKELAFHILGKAEWISMKEVRESFPNFNNREYTDFLRHMAQFVLKGSDTIKPEDVRLKCMVLDDFSIEVTCFSEVGPLLEDLCRAFKVVAVPKALNAENFSISCNSKILMRELVARKRKEYYDFVVDLYPKFFCEEAFELYPGVKKIWEKVCKNNWGEYDFELILLDMRFKKNNPDDTPAIDYSVKCNKKLKKWANVSTEFGSENFRSLERTKSMEFYGRFRTKSTHFS